MRRSMNSSDAFAHGEVSQRPSTNSQDVEQVDWLNVPARRRPSDPVDAVRLRAIPKFHRAIAYSLHLAGMDPKEAYGPLAIDKASWSRMINGQQGFPASLIHPVRMLAGNQAGLMWLAYQDNCEVKPLQTELEQQLEARDRRIAELEKRLEIQLEFVQQLMAGRR